MSEHALIAETERGRQARLVLESQIYREAIDGLRAQLLSDWCNSQPGDIQGRERAWLAQNLLGKIESHLSSVMTTGEMATLQLAEGRTRLQAAAEWLRGW